MNGIPDIRTVQSAAKSTLAELVDFVSPVETESSIARFAASRLAQRGFAETWYYDCPALVLLGSRSCLSVSGREYVPGTESVGSVNLVTVDLSPCNGPTWGDCARSIFVEDGRGTDTPISDDFRAGAATLHTLHSLMAEFVQPDTTFDELFRFANALIADLGYKNLDLHRNLGHSIESRLEDRRYIEAGNETKLSEATAFTFEPHISLEDGRWGFKHEDIYYFDQAGYIHAL